MNRQMSQRAEPAEPAESTRLPPGQPGAHDASLDSTSSGSWGGTPQLAASCDAPAIAAELPTAQKVVLAHPLPLSAKAPVAPEVARAPESGPGAAPSPQSTLLGPRQSTVHSPRSSGRTRSTLLGFQPHSGNERAQAIASPASRTELRNLGEHGVDFCFLDFTCSGFLRVVAVIVQAISDHAPGSSPAFLPL